jgi:hypothetical protein
LCLLLEYYIILIDIYSFRKKGSINIIYNIVEVSRLLVLITKNPRILKKKIVLFFFYYIMKYLSDTYVFRTSA